MALISRQLALNGLRRSARDLMGHGYEQDGAGRKGRSRKLSNRKVRDLGEAFDGQLPLRDEMADQTVVGRVAR